MLWNLLFYVVPWWVWLAVSLVVAVALFLSAVRAFGWDRVKPWVAPVTAVIGAAALLTRAGQRGWQAKAKQDIAAADRLIQRAQTARDKSEKDSTDPKKLREDDGFRRD